MPHVEGVADCTSRKWIRSAALDDLKSQRFQAGRTLCLEVEWRTRAGESVVQFCRTEFPGFSYASRRLLNTSRPHRPYWGTESRKQRSTIRTRSCRLQISQDGFTDLVLDRELLDWTTLCSSNSHDLVTPIKICKA